MGQPAPGPKGDRGDRGERGPEGPPGKSNLAWASLTEEQKAEIMSGLQKFPELRGPKGDQGPPGKDGVSDPTQVAQKLLASGDLPKNIAKELTSVKDFNENLAATFTDPTKSYQQKLVLALYDKIDPAKGTTFIDSFSDYLTQNSQYKDRLRGEPGSVADFDSMKRSLVTKTLWCADGEFCKLPANYWNSAGSQTAGNVVSIQLNAETQNLGFGDNSKARDPNHGLAHSYYFGKNAEGKYKIPVDGPFLYGKDGGQLGFVQKTEGKDLQGVALSWNTAGNLTMTGDTLTLANGWTITTGADNLVINKDGQTKMSLHKHHGLYLQNGWEFNPGGDALRIKKDGDNTKLHIGADGILIAPNNIKTWNEFIIKDRWALLGDDNQFKIHRGGVGDRFTIHPNGELEGNGLAGYLVGQKASYGIKVAGNGEWADMGKTHSQKGYHWVRVNFERF